MPYQIMVQNGEKHSTYIIHKYVAVKRKPARPKPCGFSTQLLIQQLELLQLEQRLLLVVRLLLMDLLDLLQHQM